MSDIKLLHKYDYKYQGTGGKIMYFSKKSILKMTKFFSQTELKKIEKKIKNVYDC